MDYSRQELYLGREESNKLRKKTVCIIGIGALGSRVSELLARSGVNLILIDRDVIEESNLQRQNLFDLKDVGKPKAEAAERKLKQINNEIRITSHDASLDKDNINLINSDIVIDCTDNFFTRFLINDYCSKNKIKWIHGSAIESKGYLFNIIPGEACFRCIFDKLKGYGTCNTVGVLNSITNFIASMQANEAVKILLGKRYENSLVYANLENNEIKKFKVKNNKDCKTCRGDYEYLSKNMPIVSFCGSNKFQFKGNFDAEKIKKNIGDKLGWIVRKDRIVIKARDEAEAVKLFSKYVGN